MELPDIESNSNYIIYADWDEGSRDEAAGTADTVRVVSDDLANLVGRDGDSSGGGGGFVVLKGDEESREGEEEEQEDDDDDGEEEFSW